MPELITKERPVAEVRPDDLIFDSQTAVIEVKRSTKNGEPAMRIKTEEGTKTLLLSERVRVTRAELTPEDIAARKAAQREDDIAELKLRADKVREKKAQAIKRVLERFETIWSMADTLNSWSGDLIALDTEAHCWKMVERRSMTLAEKGEPEDWLVTVRLIAEVICGTMLSRDGTGNQSGTGPAFREFQLVGMRHFLDTLKWHYPDAREVMPWLFFDREYFS